MRISGPPPQHIIEKMSPEDRKAFGVKTNEEKAAMLEEKSEKELQQQCEAWLRQIGFWPRTPAFLDGKVPPKGWYIHVHSAKKNPIVLDLLILRWDGIFIEIELKTKTGAIREHQNAILNSNQTELCRSFEEFCGVVKGWMWSEGEGISDEKDNA